MLQANIVPAYFWQPCLRACSFAEVLAVYAIALHVMYALPSSVAEVVGTREKSRM